MEFTTIFDTSVNTSQGNAAVLTEHDKKLLEYANTWSSQTPSEERRYFHGGVKYFIFHIRHNGVERICSTKDCVIFFNTASWVVFRVMVYYDVFKDLHISWYDRGWLTNPA